MKNYFTIEELCQSETAEEYGIDNSPDNNIIEHLKELIAFLNPIRDAWGSPLIVTSGYRCWELNKIIGGVKTSSHLFGYAVDLIPQNGKFEEFKSFIVNYFKNNNLTWDQLLFEQSRYASWIHIGLYNKKHQQRCQIKHLNV